MPATPGGVLGRELMCAMHGRNCEARTFLPRYGSINERRNKLHEVIRLSGANISIGDSDHPLVLKVASLQPSRIQVYFIDNEDFFQKEDSDSDIVGSNRADNAYRLIFYARGASETVKRLQWEPNLISISGWFSSLFLPYMRKLAADTGSMKDTKMVYTVTDDTLQTPLLGDLFEKMQADGIDTTPYGEFTADTDLLHRMAILNADAVVFLNSEPKPDLEALAAERGIPVLRDVPTEIAGTVNTIKDFLAQLQEA